jgi:hypothetical protein
MKLHKLLVFMLVFSLAVMTSKSVFAQDEPAEMTMEDWQKMMDEYTAKKDQLTIELNNLNTEIDGLKKTNSDKDAALTKAENDLYAAVGSSKSGVADYRKEFEATEKMINSKSGNVADARKKFDMLKASKVRCLPEFWDRFNAMEKKLLDWEKPVEPPKSNKYTVVKGDCLYKIAAKKEIYNNGRMWPVLWDANKTVTLDPKAPKKTPTKITNPNLIYPGQQLVVPTLTDKMKQDALKVKNKWMKKRTKKSDTTTGTETKKDEKKDMKKDEKKDMKKDEKKDTKKDVKKDEKKDVKKDEKKDVKKDEKKDTKK